MVKARTPTKAQRAGLAKALLLKKRCEALGVEWDGALLKDGEWSLDERRYTALEMKMAEALFNKLGLDSVEIETSGSFVKPLRDLFARRARRIRR